MPKLSLRQAATASSVSKSTILRAIQSGRLSATRNDKGGYDIDPAELFRVYPAPERDKKKDQNATDFGTNTKQDGPVVVHELQMRVAVLEAELAAATAERDRWHEQASRLAIAGPSRTNILKRLFGKVA